MHEQIALDQQAVLLGGAVPGAAQGQHHLAGLQVDGHVVHGLHVAVVQGVGHADEGRGLVQGLTVLLAQGGETAVAVFDVIQNTSYLILYLFEGTGRAMQPILSTYQGEHNRQGMRNTVRLGFTAGLTVGGALIVLVELWPAGMCLLFGIAGSASEALACTALRLYGAGALFAGINILLCNYYQACENEKPSFLLETLRGAVLLIPLTFVCYAFGLQRFWLLFLLTEAGSLAVFLLLGPEGTALRQRPDTGLLAGLWEYPHVPGRLTEEQAARQLRQWGLTPRAWMRQMDARHIFTHIRWEMTGYLVQVEGRGPADWLWADGARRQRLAIPSAFDQFTRALPAEGD